MLFGGGLLGAVLVGGISTASLWAMSRAGWTNHAATEAWAWGGTLLGLYPPMFMFWRMGIVPLTPPDHWLCSAAAVAHFGSTYVLHPLQHYFLPAVAGLSIVKEEEQKRLDSLRMTGITEGEFLVGKWLGVLTPFAIFWLVLVPGPLVWLACEGAPPAYLGLEMPSSLLFLAVIALLGLCASACCRSVTTALVVAYLLAWGVPMLAGSIFDWLLYRTRTLQRSDVNVADDWVQMLVFGEWSWIMVSPLVLIATFFVARHFLRRRWRKG